MCFEIRLKEKEREREKGVKFPEIYIYIYKVHVYNGPENKFIKITISSKEKMIINLMN